MITMQDIIKFVGGVVIVGLMSWLAVQAVVHCLDAEADQVRDGIKDARTAVLPVPLLTK